MYQFSFQRIFSVQLAIHYAHTDNAEVCANFPSSIFVSSCNFTLRLTYTIHDFAMSWLWSFGAFDNFAPEDIISCVGYSDT